MPSSSSETSSVEAASIEVVAFRSDNIFLKKADWATLLGRASFRTSASSLAPLSCLDRNFHHGPDNLLPEHRLFDR